MIYCFRTQSSELTYARMKKMFQTANIWLFFIKYVISAGLLWWISWYIGEVSDYSKISASVEVNESDRKFIKSCLVPLK